jgi:hypothetical protein
MNDYPDNLDNFDPPDELSGEFSDEEGSTTEAYCMICKQKTPMEYPEPIWTRRGAPGTRGICSVCGTVVFRMGKTTAHAMTKRPEPVQVAEAPYGRGTRKSGAVVTYVNYSVLEAEFAALLADDLNKIGIQTWLAENDVDNVHWATGVHPALVECKRMILVLTPLAAKATNVTDAWRFFLEHHKPIFIVQLEATEVPSELRTKPRIDFSGDYKRALRQLVQALNS